MASRSSLIFVTVCYMLLGGSSCFSVGLGAGNLNFVVVLFCFCLFYLKLHLYVVLGGACMRCFIYDAGYIGSDGPVLVSNPRKIRSRDVLVSVVAFLLLCL